MTTRGLGWTSLVALAAALAGVAAGCAEPLAHYGQSIQTSGPAGEEFDRL